MVTELIKMKIENKSDRLKEIAGVYELFSQMRKHYERFHQNEPENRMKGSIRSSVDYLKKNYSMPVTINDLSEFVGLDRTQIYRLFVEQFGISPKEYLLTIRMEKAKQLLVSTDLPVKSISFSVGYQDPYLFSKMFKKKVGISPKGYRDS